MRYVRTCTRVTECAHLHATKTKVVTRTPVLDSYSSYDERQSFFRRRKRENERRRRRRRAEASSSSSSSSFVVPDDVANEDDEDADELTKTKTTRLYCLLTACFADCQRVHPSTFLLSTFAKRQKEDTAVLTLSNIHYIHILYSLKSE